MTARVMLLAVAVTALAPAAPAAGQARNELPPNIGPEVETAPIRCWWRTSAGAITLGEPFDVRLTCAVLETQSVQVMPDESRLSVAGVPLKPFEVVGGSHPADTRAGDRRFFQYRYTLRLINPDSIGQDVSLPALPITYKIESRVAEDGSIAGRDFIYVMPDLTMRVVAQVPNDVNDIRDGSDVGLERVEALNFRARLLDLGALASLAGGVLLGVLALVGVVTARRPAKAREQARLPERRVLAAAGAALARVAREAEPGWTPELVSAGHAALRVVAAVALGRKVSERPLVRGEVPGPGRLEVRPLLPRGAGAAVTSPTTPADVAEAMAAASGAPLTADASWRPLNAVAVDKEGLGTLRDALAAFTAAQFASGNAAPDAGALSHALEAGRAEASRLARARLLRPFKRFGMMVKL